MNEYNPRKEVQIFHFKSNKLDNLFIIFIRNQKCVHKNKRNNFQLQLISHYLIIF